jgi:NADPH-dependent 2,4-dienoyl-CoA reductase/sulfur reductase-like enzyme/nitrite reductase/ring-hydroxylating ferredoxin subunit
MRTVDVDGEKVLLIRTGDGVHAISATCPHAGASLGQGVLHGDRIVCPWHKATFCIRAGALLEPPAVDNLARFDVRIDAGRVKLSRPETRTEHHATDGRCFVIVGGGAAGAVAAQTLRQEGFSGRIVVLDRENRVPYDRTVLSKYFLSGEQGAEKSPLQTQSFYRGHRIERLAAEVKAIDHDARRIICADGSILTYDAALLATGGSPKRPPIPGAGAPNVFLLRNRADADAILARAERSESVVVLGASFIGMEVAASLRERGLDVTVVTADQAPFERQLGKRIGDVFTGLHERHGVMFRFGQHVAEIIETGVALRSGETVAAEMVVIGFGVAPAIGYLPDAYRHDDGGVPVDANLRVADGLFAAGDIARFPLYGDGQLIRVEHWRVAQQHGRVAALNMLGRNVRYESVPVFWTIQYLKRLDYIGHATDWDGIVVHGDIEKPEFLAYYVKNSLVVAAIGLDRDKDTAALAELFSIRHDWTAEALGPNPAEVLRRLG